MAEGAALRERHQLDIVLRRFWEALKGRHQAGAAAEDTTSYVRRQVDRALRRIWGPRWLCTNRGAVAEGAAGRYGASPHFVGTDG